MLSVPYVERVEIFNNSSFWANQVKVDKSQKLTLFYVSPEKERLTINSETLALTYMQKLQGEHVENMKANRC